MAREFKFFMAFENRRNTFHTPLYQRLLRKAFGDEHEIVLVGHHFMVMPQTNVIPTGDKAVDEQARIKAAENDLRHLNEIPSADTCIFDHEIMTAVFGSRAIDIMVAMAKVPCEEREPIIQKELDALNA